MALKRKKILKEKIKKKMLKYLLIPAFMLACLPVFGSQLHLVSLEKDAKKINTVLQLEVTDVEKKSEHMKLKNGKKGPMTSTAIIVTGKVKEVIWGKCDLKQIKTKYTWLVPIKYNKKGKKIFSFSVIKSGSGIEDKAEVGKEYLFSFKHLSNIQEVQHHMRMDELSKKDYMLKILENAD